MYSVKFLTCEGATCARYGMSTLGKDKRISWGRSKKEKKNHEKWAKKKKVDISNLQKNQFV